MSAGFRVYAFNGGTATLIVIRTPGGADLIPALLTTGVLTATVPEGFLCPQSAILFVYLPCR